MDIITTDNKLCCNCYACVRACPVNAITFQEGIATIVKEDCILCGNCVKVCSLGAKVLYDDTPQVKDWLLRGDKTAAVVAPSFAATFDCTAGQLISGLKKLGFSQVLEVAFGAEIYAYRHQQLLASQRKMIISTPCPSVVFLVEKHFPHLIPFLAPVQSPMMITGQIAKQKYPGCKTVFIGPCISKKAEAIIGYAGNTIDGVITFKQLKKWFNEESVDLLDLSENQWDTPGANSARLLPLAGGLLKTLGLYQDVESLDIIEASGPVKCKSILHSINSGSLTPVIVDLLACDGCIGGTQIDCDDLCFDKAKKIISYTEKSRLPGDFRYPADFAELTPDINIDRNYTNKQRIKRLFTNQEIWGVLRQTGKESEKDLINCGACGYSSCREKAIAVLHGKAEFQMCLPFLLKQFRELNASMATMLMISRTLEHRASTDSLTGLYNHRRFQEELEAYIESSTYNSKTFALYIIDIDNFKGVNDLYGHQTGDKILLQMATLVREFFSSGFVSRYGGDEFTVIIPCITPEEALSIGKQFNRFIKHRAFSILEDNASISLTASVGIACFPINARSKSGLLKLADHSLHMAKRSKDNTVLYSSVLDDIQTSHEHHDNIINTIKTLNIVINAKDQYTYKHSERVVLYAEILARKLAMPEQDIKYLRYGAFLHDIGKIKIDMSILLKPNKLDTGEFEEIKKHPVIGANIAKEIPALYNSLPVILHHHERYDGKGYPHGLKGQDIPLFGRIAAIADSFDAMTTDRPYKKALTLDHAVGELKKNSGTQFDPELVKYFISCI